MNSNKFTEFDMKKKNILILKLRNLKNLGFLNGSRQPWQSTKRYFHQGAY